MTKNSYRMGSALMALAATAALGACNQADKTGANPTATDTSAAIQTVPAGEGDEASGRADDSSGVAREMHNQMNRDSEMHDAMKDGAMKDGSMPDDHMGPMGPGMQGKGMGKPPASDAAPKDKADPMPPMNDM